MVSNRRVEQEEALKLAKTWNVDYIETSAKTRENVDRAFSEMFIKVKEAKKKRAMRNSSMSKEEEKKLREHAKNKRTKKCTIL